jgi:hypothetical protein
MIYNSSLGIFGTFWSIKCFGCVYFLPWLGVFYINTKPAQPNIFEQLSAEIRP